MMLHAVAIAAACWIAGSGFQPPDQVKPEGHTEPIPAEIAIDAMVRAYSTKTVADEVRIKVRVPGDIERTEFFVIRIQPGAAPQDGPLRFFLDFGRLKVLGADESLTAINAVTPGKYARRTVTGRLGMESLFGFIPPIAIPQLMLASGNAAAFSAPTPFTTGVKWMDATADDSVRPPVVALSGSGPSGTIVVTANADSGRLLSLRAAIPGRTGDTILDMTMRGVDPGDPGQWMLRTEGRTLVPSVSDLRPSLASRPAVLEDLTGTRADGTTWSLYQSLPVEGTKPLGLVLIRGFDEQSSGVSPFADAQRGIAAIRSAIRGSPESQPPRPGIEMLAATMIVVGPEPFQAEHFGAIEQRWLAAAPPGEDGDRAMWTTSGSTILDKAGAVLAVVNPDRTLRTVIPLDGRSDAAVIADELRTALAEPAKKETAAPEAPR